MLRCDIPWLKKYRATNENRPGCGQPRFVARDRTRKTIPNAAKTAVATRKLPVCGKWRKLLPWRTPSAQPSRKQRSAPAKNMMLKASIDSPRDWRGVGSGEVMAAKAH